MIATLERPVIVPVPPQPARSHLLLVPPSEVGPVALPALTPVALPAVEQDRPEISLAPAASIRPLRLTIRARRLLVGLGLLCCAAIGVAALDVLAALLPSSATSYAAQEAPYVGSGTSDSGGLVPSAGSTVTVAAGDTLWSLAESVDPDADPRDVIAAIMTLNDLDSSALQAGQVLRLP